MPLALLVLLGLRVDKDHRGILANRVRMAVPVMLVRLAGRVHLESVDDQELQVLLDQKEIRYIS